MIFKKKIKPTKSMIEQSHLWELSQEDHDIVEQLYVDIIATAKKKGFSGICDIDNETCNDECLCYVYNNEQHKQLACDGKDNDYECVGHPLALIRVLNEKLGESQ